MAGTSIMLLPPLSASANQNRKLGFPGVIVINEQDRVLAGLAISAHVPISMSAIHANKAT